MMVPVDWLQPGDVLVLPSGRQVTCERVDKYDDGTYIVRWWRPAERGEPGWRGPAGGGAHNFGEAGRSWPADGRYLGSFAAKRRGDLVRVASRA